MPGRQFAVHRYIPPYYQIYSIARSLVTLFPIVVPTSSDTGVVLLCARSLCEYYYFTFIATAIRAFITAFLLLIGISLHPLRVRAFLYRVLPPYLRINLSSTLLHFGKEGRILMAMEKRDSAVAAAGAPRDLAALPRLRFVPASSSVHPLISTPENGTDLKSSHTQPALSHPSSSHSRSETDPPFPPHPHPSSPRVTPLPSEAALRFPIVTNHGPGLHNVGNTCYANATLQALLHCPIVLHVAWHHVQTPHPRSSHRSFCALCALRRLAKSMFPSLPEPNDCPTGLDKPDLHSAPRDFVIVGQPAGPKRPPPQPRSSGHESRGYARQHSHPRHIQDPSQNTSSAKRAAAVTPSMFVDPCNLRQIVRTFQPSRQEDAHEFLRGLLDSATRSSLLGCGAPPPSSGSVHLSRDQELKSVVHTACGGILQSGVKCRACGHESITLEPFLDLSIGLAPTLERALSKFTAPDILDGQNMYRCESCHKKVVAHKRFSIRTAPNSLTIHLKRFDGYRKDRSNISYPSSLNLESYMVRDKDMTRRATNLYYSLVGVLVHDGPGTRSGHYFSFVKGSNGTWCLKNDATSNVVPESRALNQQAYILFYSREPQKDIGKPMKRPVLSVKNEMSCHIYHEKSSSAGSLTRNDDVTTLPNASLARSEEFTDMRKIRTAFEQESMSYHQQKKVTLDGSLCDKDPPGSSNSSSNSESDTDPGSEENIDLMGDRSDGSRDSSVRALFAGSGQVVRKIGRRLMNYVGSSGDSAHACLSDDIKLPFPSSSRVSSSAEDDAGRGKHSLGQTEGVVFRNHGIQGWEKAPNDTGHRATSLDVVNRNHRLTKRPRARDPSDIEYDRGKVKKLRRSRQSPRY